MREFPVAVDVPQVLEQTFSDAESQLRLSPEGCGEFAGGMQCEDEEFEDNEDLGECLHDIPTVASRGGTGHPARQGRRRCTKRFTLPPPP